MLYPTELTGHSRGAAHSTRHPAGRVGRRAEKNSAFGYRAFRTDALYAASRYRSIHTDAHSTYLMLNVVDLSSCRLAMNTIGPRANRSQLVFLV